MPCLFLLRVRAVALRATSGGVLAVMRELREDGMTMVVVSHEMGFAKAAADRVVFMADGLIVEEGDPADFFDAPRHERTRNFIRQIERN